MSKDFLQSEQVEQDEEQSGEAQIVYEGKKVLERI